MRGESGPDGADDEKASAVQLMRYDEPRLLLASVFTEHDPIAEAYALTLTSAVHGSEVTALD